MNEPEAVDWGLDAPGVVRTFRIVGAVLEVVGVVVLLFVNRLAGIAIFAVALGYVLTAWLMVRSSRRGKVAERERVLDTLLLEGRERILDIGCGRGLLLVGAALRVPGGTAVGVDIWRERDQQDNRPEATLANAAARGVADRVEVVDADMRDLPFGPGSFDAVVSSLAIHSLPTTEDRERACLEIARVLRPGGRVAILDTRATRQYAEVLEGLAGLEDVRRSGLRWSTYPPARLVTGRRPADDDRQGSSAAGG